MSSDLASDWVPDPLVPAYLVARQWENRPFSLIRKRQRGKRDDILAAARAMIAEGGLDSVRITEIAGQCDISIQTMYNLIGGRRRIIADALNEHIIVCNRNAARLEGFPNSLLAIADAHWQNCAKNEVYIRHATLSLLDTELSADVYARQMKLMVAELRRQQASKILMPQVPIQDLAENLVVLAAHAMLQWATHGCSRHDLRRKLVNGQASLLLGAMTSPNAHALARWLSGYMHRIA